MIWLVAALSAHGETDSSSLRALFGPPMKKVGTPPSEVFTVLPGVEMTATYSITGSKVCRLEIPHGVASKEKIDRILEQAVPASTRGKKWNSVEGWFGLGGNSSTRYERVIVSEDLFTSQVINKNPGAVVTFKDKLCGWKPGDPLDRPPQRESQPFQKR
jgi:hypothetical protein